MIKSFFKTLGMICLTLSIPALLVVDHMQSSKFTVLAREVRVLDSRQYELIESNNRLIAGISSLSSPQRIEAIAQDQLKMRKARPEEILRIEVKGKNAGT